MVKKILATVKKEWLLLSRDIAGLALLLLMPATLIIVMALVQDAPFRDYQETSFDLLLADNDHGSLAREIKTGLRKSRNFKVIDTIKGEPVSETQLKVLLNKGEYHIGIVIPEGATAEVINSANLIANDISDKLGMPKLPARQSRDSMYVRMYFDPVTKPTFRMSVSNALDKYITYSCSNLLVQRLSQMGKSISDTNETTEDFKKVFSGIGIREEQLSGKIAGKELINSVQHNVPAWAIFGMYFIVVTIAGQMIRERDEGGNMRVMLIPNTLIPVALGKIYFYVAVCSIQFLVMLCIGIWAMPVFGLPSLYLGLHPLVLIPVIFCIALAATSFGYFIGSVFKTTNQALPVGSISIVILSALGGIWVPVEILPSVLQKIALISPLHWSLDAVNQVLLRNLGFSSVTKHLYVLLAFSFILWIISTILNSRRAKSI